RRDWRDEGPDCEVSVHELVAESPEAYAALAAHLFGQDLVRRLTWDGAAEDEPMLHLVDGPRRLAATVGHNLWVRVVDVGRALEVRRYACPVDVVLDVRDERCPWNAGR